MASSADNAFLNALGKKLGRTAVTHVRFKIPSRTLRRALNTFQPIPGKVFVQIPHYWALYVHDGRGPFGPRNSRFLVWFRDPKDDPRLRSGHTPVRASQLKRLTRAQYQEGLRRNRAHIAAGRKPSTMPMIVTRIVKRRQKGAFFFHNRFGMAGFGRKASKIIETEFGKFLRRKMPKAFEVEEDIATTG